MKTTIRLITVAGAALVMSATGAGASDWSDNLYVGADIGPMLQQGATFSQSLVSGVRNDITYNPGIRGDITVGYNLNDTLAVELESGAMWNSMNKFGSVPLSTFNQSFDFCSVPILANVVYKVPTGTEWTPYFGVGAGGVISSTDFRSASTHYCDTALNVAYQAEAGLSYALTKNASIGIAYKFLSTPTQRYYLKGINDHVKIVGIYTHAVVLGFTWNF